MRQAACLRTGPGHNHAASEQGTLLEPVQLVVQGADSTHDNDGRIGKGLFFCIFRQACQSADKGALAWRRAAVDQGSRRCRIHARIKQVADNIGQVLHAHDKDKRGGASCKGRPVKGAFFLLRILMPGNYGDRGGKIPVRQRDASIGGSRNGRADARHFDKAYACLQKLLGFFSAAAEDIRVAAFQACHIFAFLCLFYEEGIDLVLRQGMLVCNLAHIDFFCIRTGKIKEAGIGKGIVDYAVGRAQDVAGLQRQQAGIARSCANEIDCSVHQKSPRPSSRRVRAAKPLHPSLHRAVFLSHQSTPAISR